MNKDIENVFQENFIKSMSPALESHPVQIDNYGTLFINGKFTKANSRKRIKSINPANEKVLAEFVDANEKDVDSAMVAATKAQVKWAKLPGSERAKYLFKIARLIQENSRELAVLETMDGGKPIKESRDVDLPLVAAHFFYYAGWADKLKYLATGATVSPVGVCAQVIPWNFPLMMAAWKIAPALAAGNTVVIKPAESTSLSLLKLAELFQQINLPPGVVNVVTGGGATGAALISHKLANKAAFTGSTSVGKQILRANAGKNIKGTMELGGKSANIVFADCAIDQAIEGVVAGIYFNQGHVCCAGSRLLIQESIEQEFLKKLQKRIAQLRVGNPLDKNTDIGAINSKEQLITIKKLVANGIEQGCEYYQAETSKLPTKGYYHQPSYFRGLASGSTINRVEIFGPVLAVSTFRTVNEAIIKANDSRFGLAAGVWTSKPSRVHFLTQKLKAGIIWTNTYNNFDPTSPFGGFKESGFGREGGWHGLFPYVNIKGANK